MEKNWHFITIPPRHLLASSPKSFPRVILPRHGARHPPASSPQVILPASSPASWRAEQSHPDRTCDKPEMADKPSAPDQEKAR